MPPTWIRNNRGLIDSCSPLINVYIYSQSTIPATPNNTLPAIIEICAGRWKLHYSDGTLSHYLKQSWIIVNWSRRKQNQQQVYFQQNTHFVNERDTLQTVFNKISVIFQALFRQLSLYPTCHFACYFITISVNCVILCSVIVGIGQPQ